MNIKLLTILVCLFVYMPTSYSQCVTAPNQNIVYGTVFSDLNQNGSHENSDSGVENVSVNLYQDFNGNGIIDSGDVMVTSGTSNGSGDYSLVISETPTTNNVADYFNSISFSNNNGSENWSNSWDEMEENNGAHSGNVRVESGKLRFGQDTNGNKDMTGVGVDRTVNLSTYDSATLSFDFSREIGDSYGQNWTVNVQVSSDGTTYTTLDNFSFNETQQTYSFDISSYISDTTHIRIIGVGEREKEDNYLYFDNLNVSYSKPNAVNLDYIVSIDETTIPNGGTLTTASYYSVAFTAFGQKSCDNDFGFVSCNLLESNLEFICDDNGTPFNVSDDFYNITLNPEGTNLGDSYTVSGDFTGTGTYGAPQSFGPFPVSAGDKSITITDNSGNCSIEDIEISVSDYSCLQLNGDYSIDFDGVDDYIDSDLNLENYDQATIMVWAKIASDFSDSGYIINFDNLKIEAYHSQQIKVKVNNALVNVPTTYKLEKDIWAHIAIVFNSSLPSSMLKIYVNGEMVVENDHVSLSSPIYASAYNFTIGAKGQDHSKLFKGEIDEVRVFDIALSENQMRKIIHQEIQENAGSVSGVVVPKTIIDESTNLSIPWANLKAYYPMTDIANLTTSDFSNNGHTATLHNITTFLDQTAPMPYTTIANGTMGDAQSWLYGDNWNMDALSNTGYAIIKVDNDVSVNATLNTAGLIIAPGKRLTVNGDNLVSNSWYLELNGILDLQDDSQLVQTETSDLVTSSTGKVLRRQEGTTSPYWYNYWSSPVGELGETTLSNDNASANNTNNSPFSLNMIKDGTGSDYFFTNGYTGNGSISSYWLFTYMSGQTYWDWKQISTSTAIAPGVGYTQKGTGVVGAEQEYIFEGKPNNGTILIDVVKKGSSSDKTQSLVGNPYPSAIDVGEFLDDNAGVISGCLQFWQQWGGTSHNLDEYDGGYATVNKLGSTRAFQFDGLSGGVEAGSQNGTKILTKSIPVGQGFMVSIIADGQIEFNNSQRVFVKEADANGSYDSGSVFFKGTKKATASNSSETSTDTEFKKIRLVLNSITGPETHRELLLGFSDKTSDSFDYGYDAENMVETNNDLLLDFEGKDMLIQAYSALTAEKVVPLNFKSSGDNSFEIKLSELENIDENQSIYLKDNQTGTYFDLTQNKGYEFNSDHGVFNTRFELVFQNEQASLSTEASSLNENHVYYKNSTNTLFIKNLNSDVNSLSLVNMSGQVVLEMKDVAGATLQNGLQFNTISTGAYVVYMRTEANEVLTKKIIVK
ncbi:MAG: LamG-like jellyroll fold domain-containing protein [Algibacter sp.]|uniref:LamG-like jellyroll fold domain-containing protein n=1 Tax=Algibacter sp. TaxID=1872428 RepID=UPI0032990DD8